MRHVLAVLFVAMTVFAAHPALAQNAAAPKAAAAAAPAMPALSPAEAQAVLDVLNDPVKRAAFAARIQLFVKATQAAAPAPGPAVPLAPGSVGAQVVAQVAQSATWLSGLTGQVDALHKLLGNLPAVGRFLAQTWEDPELRAQAVRAFGGLAAFLLGAIGVEWGVSYMLRQPVAALAARAAGPGTQPAVQGEATADGADKRADPPRPAGPDGLDLPTGDDPAGGDVLEDILVTPPARRFDRLVRVLRRVPFALARLVLDLLPVGIFLALSYGLLLFAQQDTQDVLMLAIRTYVAARLVLVGTRVLVSPAHPSLRLIHLSGPAAAYVVRWMRRLVTVAAGGFLVVSIGVLYDMPAVAIEALIKLFSLTGHIMLIIVVLQLRAPVARRLRAGAVSHDAMARVRDALADYWHWPAIFLIAATWVVWAVQLRHGLERVFWLGLGSVGILVAYRIAATILLGGLERLLGAREGESDRAAFGPHRYLGLLRHLLNAALLTLTALVLLSVWGIHALAWFQAGKLGGQLASAGAAILVSGLICLAVWEAANASLDSQLARLVRQAQGMRAARLRTLLPILRTSLLVLLLTVFGLTSLSEIGVNIAPLLAGAGILGVAIGFGSQKLVQDFITGIFLLLENAMQVGDWVNAAGFSGTVEALSIRTLKLRGTDGVVHVIPFSAVTTVSNSHRGIGVVSVSVTVDAAQDTDQVSDVLAEVAAEMKEERRFADMMNAAFQLFGVDRLDAGTATITGQISCTDTGRLPVQREFNRRLNMRLRQMGVRLMAPVQSSLALTLPAPPGQPAPPTEAAETPVQA